MHDCSKGDLTAFAEYWNYPRLKCDLISLFQDCLVYYLFINFYVVLRVGTASERRTAPKKRGVAGNDKGKNACAVKLGPKLWEWLLSTGWGLSEANLLGKRAE